MFQRAMKYMEQQKKIEFLSRKTGISIKELRRLNQDLWYHGTTIEDAESIKNNGVIANYNIGTELDFGPGFYMTDTYERAENYISRVPVINALGNMIRRETWAVVEFKFNPFDFLLETYDEYACKCFPKHNEEFAKFSFDNRVFNLYNEKPHGYDIIWGVMSDSFPDKVILDYKNGKITYEEALELLRKPNSMKQLYLENQKICDMLNITNIYIKEGNEYARKIYN